MGRRTWGEDGMLPRSSSGDCDWDWLTLRPSKWDLKEETGLIGAASVSLSIFGAMVFLHRHTYGGNAGK